MKFDGFDRRLFRFLSELARNNNRNWFQKNKARYEDEVQKPALAFIEAVAPALRKISPHVVAAARKSGGSMMRVYRDTRFSKDKKPYKTNVGIQFRHTRGKDVLAPGFYLHLDPKASFIGTGIYQPDGDAVRRIRTRIDKRQTEWGKLRIDAGFRRHFKELGGESLKRPPQGFDPDHPFIEDLKRKDFVSFRTYAQKDVLKPGFLQDTVKAWTASKPLMKFICDSLGLRF